THSYVNKTQHHRFSKLSPLQCFVQMSNYKSDAVWNAYIERQRYKRRRCLFELESFGAQIKSPAFHKFLTDRLDIILNDTYVQKHLRADYSWLLVTPALCNLLTLFKSLHSHPRKLRVGVTRYLKESDTVPSEFFSWPRSLLRRAYIRNVWLHVLTLK